MTRQDLWRLIGTAAAGLAIARRALTTPPPRPQSTAERLARFPTQGLPVGQPVSIRWNDHQVPFIEAADDGDCAFALGLVHGHLRLGQIELMRRIVDGRLAEVAGPPAADLDHALRILGYGRAADAIVAAMPADTRRWLDRFVDGLNHYQSTVRPLPHEFVLLEIAPQPWTAAQIVTLGRLASSDVNWFTYFKLLRLRGRPDWPQLWQRLLREGQTSMPSFGSADHDDPQRLVALLGAHARSGSNSLVVSGRRSASGGAMIASDPHLGMSLPNPWLVAAYRSPSVRTVGLMIPGLPFVAVGRNARIAWGGTNMRAANSDLFDANAVPADEIREEVQTIRVRGGRDRTISVRDTPLGPLLSDAPQVRTDHDRIALRWIGHLASDEITAMVRLNQAQSWPAFRQAMAGFAISPQNMVYADVDGRIGQVMATHVPARPPALPDDLVLPADRAAAWERIVTAADLPAAFEPAQGFIVSANNRPAETAVLVGLFFSNDDRMARMTDLMAGNEAVTLEDLIALQHDIHQGSSLRLRDLALGEIERLWPDDDDDGRPGAAVVRAMADWDGLYAVDSHGAAAFELWLHHFARTLLDEETIAAYDTVGRVNALIEQDIRTADPDRLRHAFARSLTVAARSLARNPRWGNLHRLHLAHSLEALPLFGRRYRYGDHPTGGSASTVMKTSHGLGSRPHVVRFGANARHITDLSDLDRNHFVLMSGQDGWINSGAFLDQWPLWQESRYMRVPLRPETAAREFPHAMTLTP